MSWRDFRPFARRPRSDVPARAAQSAHHPVFPPKPADMPRHAAEHHRAVLAAALELPNDTPADDALLAAIAAETQARRAATGTLDGPSAPRATQLRIRTEGVPDWWRSGRNLLLCAPSVQELRLAFAMIPGTIEDQIVVIGDGVEMPTLSFSGAGGLVVLGDNVRTSATGFTVCPDCMILIGENSSIGTFGFGDARNGGVVIVGDGNTWDGATSFMTDDSHAIRDVETDERLNVYGGRIVVGSHVWLGEGVRMMGDCYVGEGCAIERDAFVKRCRIEPGSQASGRPAKTTRTGIMWGGEDPE